MLREQSAGLPYVTDLDDEGEAEVVTWWWAVWYPESQATSVLWPIVRTRVSGRYLVRTQQYPSLFGPVAQALRRFEVGYAPGDPRVSDRLGQAYEIMGDTKAAIEAYERAERKYLARGDPRAAAAVKERRLGLEAELTGSGESG